MGPHLLFSVVQDLGDNLTLELYQIHLLFSRKLLGVATIPLHSIRHSNRVKCTCIFELNHVHDHVVFKEFLHYYLYLQSSTPMTCTYCTCMQENEGQWLFLFLLSESGELVPTQHQLQVDVHFELPQGETWPIHRL